jgi:hypothetical protein
VGFGVPESTVPLADSQNPATQSFEQQSPKLTHAALDGLHVALGPPHLPCSHLSLQQSLVTMQLSPEAPQVGAAHCPLLQSPPQQSPAMLQA